MCVFKWSASVLAILGIVMILIVTSDSMIEPTFRHPLLRSAPLGVHYFVNDVVGISPKNEQLPYVYVLSHSSRAAALISNEKGGYKLVPADSFGLSQDPTVTGWGATVDHIKGTAKLQLEYLRSMVVGTVNQGNQAISGRSLEITVPWPAIHAVFGDLEMNRHIIPGGTRFTVELHGPGSFWIETRPPPSDGFSIEFSLYGFRPGEVVVGADQISVLKNSITLATRDLHSLALTELDGDAGTEFSVVRGGIRGEIGTLDPAAADLLIDTDTNREVTRKYTGFLKRGCPGRQSSWVDIDSDNDLDLYIACGRPEEPGKNFANQLFQNAGDGLAENGTKFGVDLVGYGAFRFIDWDRDLDPDLWWAGADGNLVFYKNENGHFQLHSKFSGSWAGDYRPPQLLVHDLENDGDPDLLVVHPRGNRLLMNNRGDALLQETSLYGLPYKAFAAHWADIDLNGKVDLLTASQGIYLDEGKGEGLKFSQKSGVITGNPFIYDARLVSFADAGGRKFVFAYRRCLPGKLCAGRRVLMSHLRELIRLPFDWLEMFNLIEPYDWFMQTSQRILSNKATYREISISMLGPDMNPDSIGARVDLAWGDHRESHWVGESDSALYSRGDLAVYASIPKSEVVRVHAFWQDGCEGVLSVLPGAAEQQIIRPESCMH